MTRTQREAHIVHRNKQAICRRSTRHGKIGKAGFQIMSVRRRLFRALGLHWPKSDDMLLVAELTYQVLKEHGL